MTFDGSYDNVSDLVDASLEGTRVYPAWMPIKGGLAHMFWEGIGSIISTPASHSPGPITVLASFSLPLPLFLLSMFLVVAFALAFIHAQRRWLIQQAILTARNRQLGKTNQDVQQRVLGFGNIMPQIVMETDCSGHILYINGPWQKLFLPENGRFLHPSTVFEIIHTNDRVAFEAHFQDLLGGKNGFSPRFRLQGDSGAIFPVRMTGECIPGDVKFSVQGLRLVLDDISREENKSRALFQKEATEEAITTILNSFGGAGHKGVEDALSRVLQLVAELIGADCCLLADVGSDGNTLPYQMAQVQPRLGGMSAHPGA